MTDTLEKISTIGVLGAGQMGAGIAQVAAQAGYAVLLADVSQERADAGKAGIARQLGKQVEKGKLAADVRDAVLARITPVVGAAGLAPGDFLVEAATENIELKKKLFAELDRAARPGVILATNTSSISITLIAAVTGRPERVVGMHFMNPVPLMKLVEIIRGLQTDDETVARAFDYVQALGKIPIVVKGSGSRLVIYLVYNEDAMEHGTSVDKLTWNPTAGTGWAMTAPAEKEDVKWMNDTLADRAPRISVHDVNEPQKDDEDDKATSATGVQINWGVLGNS